MNFDLLITAANTLRQARLEELALVCEAALDAIADSQRLEWMLKTRAVIIEDDHDETSRYRALLPPNNYYTREWFPTPREAIDAARAFVR